MAFKRFSATILAFAAIFTLGFSCKGGEDPIEKASAPELVSTSPSDGASGLSYDSFDVIFTFDQVIKCPQSKWSIVSIDNGATITNITPDNKKLILTIDKLKPSTTYTVSIGTGAVQGFDADQDAFGGCKLTFSTMDEIIPENLAAYGIDAEVDMSNPAWQLARTLLLGWNLGNHLDAYYNVAGKDNYNYPGETAWGNSKCTQATMDAVKAAGFTTVRIPVTWLNMIGQAPEYKVDESWMNRVEEIVGYAEKAGLNAIINTHHDENHGDDHWQDILGASDSPEKNKQIKEEITALWTQIANRFADKGSWLIFEGFNEINDGGWGYSDDFKANPNKQCDVLNEWNQTFVDAVRATGGNNATRWLAVPSYAASPSFVKYHKMPEDPAGKTILAVHCYDPYEYTIGEKQYQQWGRTAAADKRASNAEEEHINNVFKELYKGYVSKGIPVYLGEFGCSMRSANDSKAWAFYKYYMEYVVKTARSYGIPAFLWDNGAKGYGREIHGYFDHATGNYMNNSKAIIETIVKAMNDDSEDYTLESVYRNAPKF